LLTADWRGEQRPGLPWVKWALSHFKKKISMLVREHEVLSLDGTVQTVAVPAVQRRRNDMRLYAPNRR
jgi:hypothetical protein